MRINVRVFAQYADWLGTDHLVLEMPSTATVADAVRSIRSRDPSGHLIPEEPLVAVNLEHVRGNRTLADGDELALLPPLAGG
jgi:molybdopterin synthase catalytic subunit